MPAERIPFSKFGLEYVVPLCKREVTSTAVHAYSITGLTGQRKRLLASVENVAEDLWERIGVTTSALWVAAADYDDGERTCKVKILSTSVDRPVSNAATQTRKSISLTASACKLDRRQKRKEHKNSRNSSVSFRDEKSTELPDDNNDDCSSLLGKLVQLLFLQNGLAASKTGQNNSATSPTTNGGNQFQNWAFNQAAAGSSYSDRTAAVPATPAAVIYPQAQAYARGSSTVQVHSNSLLEYLREHQHNANYNASARAAQPAVSAPRAVLRPAQSWNNSGGRIYRMGSPSTQVSGRIRVKGKARGNGLLMWRL